MVNAVKWIRSFFFGKREEKERKRARSVSTETSGSASAMVPAGIKEKPRWSFKKSASKNKLVYRRNSSFDEVSTAQLVKQALEQHEIQQIRIKAILKARKEVERKALPATYAQPGLLLKDVAAAKLQSAFRAYLARRALRALKALVKLQALVRGHLVRKQTTAILRGMHALMTIQVRARVKRVQRTEEAADPTIKSTSLTESSTDNESDKAPYNDKMNQNSLEWRKTHTKSKSGQLDYSQPENPVIGVNKFRSGPLSVSRPEERHHIGRNSSTLLDTNTKNDREFEATATKNTQNIFQNSYNMSKTKHIKEPALPDNPNASSLDLLFGPGYTLETESSKAKARSQSEPKQRPMLKPKLLARRSISTDGEYLLGDTSSGSGQIEQKRQSPWFFRFYRSAKSVKDSDIDSAYLRKSKSLKARSIIPFEPSLDLY